MLSPRKSVDGGRKSIETPRKSLDSSRKSLDSSRKSLEKDRAQLEQRIANEKLPGDINSLTIALLGHPAAGKSALVASAIGKSFSKTHIPTPAYEASQKKFPLREGFTIQLVDTGGAAFLPKNLNALKAQEEKRWRDADVFAIVYACDDAQSLETARHIRNNVLTDELAKTRLALICTKIERSEKSKVVSVEDGKKLADEWGCQIYFVSAKSNENTSVFDSITVFFLEDLLASSATRGLDEGVVKRKKSFGSKLAAAISIKKDKEGKDVKNNVGSPPDSVSPRPETTPRSGGLGKLALSLSGKSHKQEVKTSEIPFAKVETTYDQEARGVKDESSEYLPPDSISHNQTTESDEFLSEHSEESKRKIRAARRRFEKQGCADGGWDQAKIAVPSSPR